MIPNSLVVLGESALRKQTVNLNVLSTLNLADFLGLRKRTTVASAGNLKPLAQLFSWHDYFIAGINSFR